MAFTGSNTAGFGGQTTTPFGATSTPANKSLFGQSNISFGTPAPSFNLGSTATTSATGFGFSSTGPTNTTLGSLSADSLVSPSDDEVLTSKPVKGRRKKFFEHDRGGFGGFGAPTTTTASNFGTFGNFNTTTTSSAPTFGFGGNTTSGSQSLFSGFGQSQPSSASAGFGAFGSSFGAKSLSTQQPTTFGNFGQSSGLGPFGQAQNQQQTTLTQQNPLEAFYKSIFQCTIYNDERDQVLKSWNLLQALWGVGKGYYDPSSPPVEYTPENPMCRFKTVGYSRKPTTEPKDGIVSLVLKKKENDIRNEETQLISSLTNILGNKPNLTVIIESIKAISDEKTQVLFFVQDKGANGIKRVVNAEVTQFLRSQGPSQTLTNMGVENVFCSQSPDLDQIKEYLETPPSGIHPRLWKQAQLDNPDPEKLVPVPIMGFGDIRWRTKCQETETRVHTAVLDKIASDIADLKRNNSETVAKIAEYKQKVMDLEHRVLKVLIKQEATRNVGIALRPEEEALRSHLEALHSQVNTPAQFKGRLNELLALMRMQRQELSQGPSERYTMDPEAQEEIHQFLLEQHYAIQQVVQTVNTDLKNLKTMTEGISILMRESGP